MTHIRLNMGSAGLGMPGAYPIHVYSGGPAGSMARTPAEWTPSPEVNANYADGAALYGPLGAADSGGFPAVATKSTAVYQQPNAKSKTIGTLGINTRVKVLAVSGGWWQIYSTGGLGWVPAANMKDAPNDVPGDGVTALQQALTDLAALGLNTDPGGVTGIVNYGTLSALANSMAYVSGDIKGGETMRLAMTAALQGALISKTVTTAATNFVRTSAKPLAVGIQIYIAKRRGAAGEAGGFLPSAPSAWNPTTVGLAIAGGVVLLGGLYLVLKK